MKKQAAAEKIKNICTTEFLENLREVARLYGWNGDYIEIEGFVRGLYEDAGISIDGLSFEPYETENA